MEEQVLKLQRNLADAQLKKKNLDTRVADCKTKLKRARKLIGEYSYDPRVSS